MKQQLAKNTQFNFRTNDVLLSEAKRIASVEHFDMATIMNALLQKIVDEQNIPAELIAEKKTRQDKIIESLYSEIREGYNEYLVGKGKPLDDVFSKYEI